VVSFGVSLDARLPKEWFPLIVLIELPIFLAFKMFVQFVYNVRSCHTEHLTSGFSYIQVGAPREACFFVASHSP
jgi:hypothetical protein